MNYRVIIYFHNHNISFDIDNMKSLKKAKKYCQKLLKSKIATNERINYNTITLINPKNINYITIEPYERLQF